MNPPKKIAQTRKKLKNFIVVSSQIVPTSGGRTWARIPGVGGGGICPQT